MPFPIVVRVQDTLTFGEEVEIPADLVVLAVGMEPSDIGDLVDMMKLPVGADGFLLEVHPKLRPVELATAGLLLAGTCQAPMDIGESCNAASAAASKAAVLLAKGSVQLDPFVAEVDPEKCEGHGGLRGRLPAGRGHPHGGKGKRRPDGAPGSSGFRALPRLRRMRRRVPYRRHPGQGLHVGPV